MSQRIARRKRTSARDINSWEINVALRDAWNPNRPTERLGEVQALKALAMEGRFEAKDAIYRRREDPLAYPQRLTPEAREAIVSATEEVIQRLTPQEPGRRK